MDRREFLTGSLAATAATLGATGLQQARAQQAESGNPARFRMKYAPHFGMFQNLGGEDPLDQIRFAADQGFHAWEDNRLMRRGEEFQTKFGKLIEKLGVTMGVFVAFGAKGSDFVKKTDKDYQNGLRDRMKQAVECAKRCRAKWTTVVPGKVEPRMEEDYMMANAVENLKVMAEVYEPHGLVMVLEPLNWWTNHPGLYLRKIPQAYMICKAVNSPACKILDDLYHQQIQEGNLIPNMQKAWKEIAYIQVGDNPGRKEPTTGEINYRNIFKWLNNKGFKGVIGMEHGNSEKGAEGEKKVIEAYRWCDNF